MALVRAGRAFLARQRVGVRAFARVPIEGGYFGLSDDSRPPKELTNMGKNLRLRGAIVHVTALLGGAPATTGRQAPEEVPLAEEAAAAGEGGSEGAPGGGTADAAADASKVDAAKVDELKALLEMRKGDAGRGIPPGRGAERQRAEGKGDQERAGAGPVAGGVADPRTKYAAKLRARGVTSSTLQQSQIDKTAQRREGDADTLKFARGLVREAARQRPAGGSWVLAKGAAPALQYLQHRSMVVVLLTDGFPLGEEDSKRFEAVQAQASLHGFHFDGVVGDSAADYGSEEEEAAAAGDAAGGAEPRTEAVRPQPSGNLWNLFVDTLTRSTAGPPPKEARRNQEKERQLLAGRRLLHSALRKAGCDAREIMVLSDSASLLQAARDLACVTCRLDLPNARRAGVTTDLSVTSIAGLKGVVEEYNGISFRG